MATTNQEFGVFLNKLPDSLRDSIESAVDFLSPDLNAIDDDFLEMVRKMSPETYEKIKQSQSDSKNQPEEGLKFKFLNRYYRDFEFLNTQEEDVIIWEGNYESNENISITNAKIVIIDGNLTCNNIIVSDSYLFVNGNVNCNILFGASGNDKMTQITLDVNARAIVENGHYTLVDGGIYAESIIMIHNEINSNKEIKASTVIVRDGGGKLSTEIIDDEGYFDEDKFLAKVESNQYFKLIE